MKLKRGRKGQNGQSMVEMALVLPILLVVLMAIIDFGYALGNYVTLTNAAREGARIGVVSCSKAADDTTIKQAVVDKSHNLLKLTDVTLSASCSTKPTNLQVSVTYSYNYITPLGGILNTFSFGTLPKPLPLTSSTSMRIEN